jgi:hypothetical protein
MVRSKPSSLANRPMEKRADERTAVNLAGRCRAGEREIQDVLVTDLGPAGCRMLGLSAGVTKSDRLDLWLGDAGPFSARLKWAKRGLLGVEFDRPLDSGLLETLANADPPPNVVPMRRGRAD